MDTNIAAVQWSRRLAGVALATVTTLGCAGPSDPTEAGGVRKDQEAFDANASLVIRQLYAATISAKYKYSYLELFNRSNSLASLNGLSVQTGTSTAGDTSYSFDTVIPLPPVTLPPGSSFLIQGSLNLDGTTGADLPVPPDFEAPAFRLTWANSMVALVRGSALISCPSTACTSQIIDGFSGYNAAPVESRRAVMSFAGAGSLERKGNGYQDTNDTFADFFANFTPVPRNLGSVLVPDTTVNAPVADPTVAMSPSDAWKFLYTGSNPLQTGMTATIEAGKAGLISGTVTDRTGVALQGVKASFVGAPEYGQTLTRANGRYDLVVTGGKSYTLRLEKAGYLSVDRTTTVAWDSSSGVPTVVMVPLDPNVKTVTLNAATTQVVAGTPSTDANGSRTGVLVVPPGTQASVDGTPATTSLNLRVTEYTVGDKGPAAMPAPIPSTTGYTYAVELSADEAIQSGAKTVTFNSPLAFYVDNFRNFPVGGIVPAGYYDTVKGAWTPSDNGIILKVLSKNSGSVQLDFTGDGVADSPSTLPGFTPGELTEIASRYAVGATFWRVPITHFSAWDCNWPFGPPAGATPPPPVPPPPTPPCTGACCASTGSPTPPVPGPNPAPGPGPAPDNGNNGSSAWGSIIRCEDQTLGESVAVPGTPFSLNYVSGRAAGFVANRQIQLNITGATVHPKLKRTEVKIDIAGQTHFLSYPPLPNVSATFTWDGNDGFGRPVYGSRIANIQMGAVYAGDYYPPYSDTGKQFGRMSPSAGVIVGDAGKAEVTIITKATRGLVGRFVQDAWSLGGWTLSAHHFYDPATGALYLGNGNKIASAGALGVIDRVGGDGSTLFKPDGTDARAAGLNMIAGTIGGVAAAPNGDIYVPIGSDKLVRRINHGTGTLSTVAGTRNQYPCSSSFGDGGLATSGTINVANDLAVGPEGSLYIADPATQRIRRVRASASGAIDPSTAIIDTVAGGKPCNGSGFPLPDFAGDGGPATAAFLSNPTQIALGPDGSLFILDAGNKRIRKVDASGLISTIAGNGGTATGPFPEGVPALGATLPSMADGDLAVGPDGTLYVSGPYLVFSIRPDGILRAISGPWSGANKIDDGVLMSTEAVDLIAPGLSVGRDGTLFFVDSDSQRNTSAKYDPNLSTGFIRAVTSDGYVTSISRGAYPTVPSDGSLAIGSGRGTLSGTLATTPDGAVLVSDGLRIFRIRPPLAKGCNTGPMALSSSGDEAYCFDSTGRHLETRNARTGATLFTFGYTSGRLTSITDASNNVTTVAKAGSQFTITSPYSQTTTINLNADGNATSIVDAEAITGLEPDASGLLGALVDRRNNRHVFHYDANGYLADDQDPDPAAGLQRVVRSNITNGVRVERYTPLNVKTTYDVTLDGAKTKTWTVTNPDGTQQIRHFYPDGRSDVLEPNGTLITRTELGDPRFGFLTPFANSETIKLPSGLTQIISRTRTASFDPLNPLSLNGDETIVSVNGQPWTTTYTAGSSSMVSTSPQTRTTTVLLDALGRPTSVQRPGVTSVDVFYDPNGRLDHIAQGARTWSYDYVQSGLGKGYLAGVTDASLVRTGYTRDVMGRPLTESRSTSTTALGWDPKSNLTSVTPPGKPTHSLIYESRDLLAQYRPPSAGLPVFATYYKYDLDHERDTETRPGAVVIDTNTETTTGRLDTVTISGGTLDYDYYAAGTSGTAAPGQVSAISGPYGTNLAFQYDGRLLTSMSWSGAVTGSVSWQYDANFRKIKETVATATSSTFAALGYDNDGLLTCASQTACNPPAADALALARDPQNGRITDITLGNITEHRDYNATGELARQVAKYSGTTLLDITYDSAAAPRDALGRIAQKQETIQATTNTYRYVYDDLRRVKDVYKNGASTALEHFDYDDNGNITGHTNPSVPPPNATYDDQDRLLTYDGTNGLTFKYSFNGEVTEIKSPTTTSTYTYDALGNLLSVNIVQGSTTTLVEYLVDGKGRRVGKKVGGTLTKQWLYGDDLRPVAELNGVGTLVAQFIYGSKSNVPDYIKRFSPSVATYRVISDALGSPRLVVNVANSADIPFNADYSTFGVASGQIVPRMMWMPFGFAGGMYDPTTGLVRFGARDYNPAIGRWMSKDPIRFRGDGPNLYAYVLNDPVNGFDLTGKGACLESLLGAAGACPLCVGSEGLNVFSCASCAGGLLAVNSNCLPEGPRPPSSPKGPSCEGAGNTPPPMPPPYVPNNTAGGGRTGSGG